VRERAQGDLLARFQEAWDELAEIGRNPEGGYDRFAWTEADRQMRAWFSRAAAERNMTLEQDRNGNLWAWWGEPGDGAIVTGSHLDSVPGGGAFDGPLGVVGSFLAVDELRSRHEESPPRAVAVVDFSDEEGARFGVACVGSRLMTGELDPDRARRLVDESGVTLAEAMRSAGVDDKLLGPDEARLSAITTYVELHIEQGRALADFDAPVGVATAIWPHGRWRLRFKGEANHAGTARLQDRHDPMLVFAAVVTAAREAAARHQCLATVGKALVHPNATNGVASSLQAWLDARAPDAETLNSVITEVRAAAEASANEQGVEFECYQESVTAAVSFNSDLRRRIVTLLGGVPEIPTGAGHDAGILSERIPTAMVFARNPTGVSHSPAERSSVEDCLAGVRALAVILEDLVWG